MNPAVWDILKFAKKGSAYTALSHRLPGKDVEAAWHLVHRLLHPDPEKRMTVQESLGGSGC